MGELDALRGVLRGLSLVGIDGRHPLARPKSACVGVKRWGAMYVASGIDICLRVPEFSG